MSDSLTLFLNQAGRIPLLTADEEILLGRRIQAMITLLQDNPSGPYSRDEQFTIQTRQTCQGSDGCSQYPPGSQRCT
jgi:hypothetical protein